MIIEFKRGKQRYEIKPQGCVFVGYVDGVPTIIGKRIEVVTRMLIEKRMGGRTMAEIVPFPKEPAER